MFVYLFFGKYFSHCYSSQLNVESGECEKFKKPAVGLMKLQTVYSILLHGLISGILHSDWLIVTYSAQICSNMTIVDERSFYNCLLRGFKLK